MKIEVLSEYQQYLNIGEVRDTAKTCGMTENPRWYITPRGWIPRQVFLAVQAIIKKHGGRWIPSGTSSRWEAPKEAATR